MAKNKWISFQKLTDRFRTTKKATAKQTKSYQIPGVYVEEISNLPKSIAQVETAVPAFIGYTEKTEIQNGQNLTTKRINSLFEYELYFGSSPKESGISIDATNHDDPTVDFHSPSKYLMHYAMQSFFANGGGSCFVVSCGIYSDGVINYQDLESALLKTSAIDEITLLVIPEAINLDNPQKHADLINRSLLECSKLKDRFSICDVYTHGGSYSDDISLFRNKVSGAGRLKYGAAYYPFLEMSLNKSFDPAKITVTTSAGETSMASIESESPYLYQSIKSKIERMPVLMPPSPAVAGQYTSVDMSRGVWKAPANVSLNQVIKPSVSINDTQQGSMNIDPVSGKSINAIRSFSGQGVLIWGARTLDGNSNEWRYVPVVRLFMMVEESIKKGLEQVVFEPNNNNTWVTVKSMIENYLTMLWKQGGIMGATPNDAYFVKVGLGSTMTPDDILEGRMIIEIGMAVVRPAEFIVFSVLQKMKSP
ncbi:phage tail sheath family protein [Algoriphagus sediminis]|uniref:Phage tail sheath C-terminal domain-containing protein n=1 Tax=Algoriphagus sediminis TaxID=3057113 RepID=A0ABT7Y9M4_9BACT|nr:phage tail sheath C-terminal domain-containing protein [Algoriphagus sediminis]MDN3203210.1 phage tail sheath C-terminal domain-containing protein [Algoriphagus sediminis]